MCGIGVVLGENEEQVNQSSYLLKKQLIHRGPDTDATKVVRTHLGNYLGFAHTRLSILDLSQQGNQPMVDNSSGNILVFNGEIYNYLEIRRELINLGEKFNSNTDTEVILIGCKVFGFKKLLSKLKGMYAFAWWDESKQKLKVARDPLGIKSLYYFRGKQGFVLTSELKALRNLGMISNALSDEAIDSFLSYGSVQPPNTIYKDVYALLPGHSIEITPENRRVEQLQFYDLQDTTKNNSLSIKSALKNSIQRHLISDVPLGVMLSGGYDSTAIASLASQLSQEELTAFTLNFPEVVSNSETNNAINIAKHLKLDHRILDISKQDINNILPDYFRAMDQPSDDGLNIFVISKKIQELSIKACLHGAGGDELFGGYPSFKDVPLLLKLKNVPQFIRAPLSRVLKSEGIVPNKLSDLLAGDINIISSYLIRRNLFSYKQRKRFFKSEPPLGLRGTTEEWFALVEKAIQGKSIQNSISTLELLQYSANKLMVDGDVMSMAHGLELRVPLLDLDLIKAKHSAINKKNFSFNYAKHDLVNSIENFPHHLINNKKFGFTIPIKYWLEQFLVKEQERVIENLDRKLNFPRSEVQKTFEGIKDANKSGERWIRSWQLFSLGMWLESNF